MNFNKFIAYCWGIAFLLDVIDMICNGFEPNQCLRASMGWCLATTNWELSKLKEQ